MRDFLKGDGGNVGITFALGLMALIAVAGVAVDYALAIKRKRTLDNALDIAMLAGTNAASQASRAGKSDWADIGLRVARNSMSSNLPSDEAKALRAFNASFTKDRTRIVVTASYDAGSATTLLKVFGIDNVNLSSSGNARVASGNYVDVHFVIDNSSSMGIGADAASQTIMSKANGMKSDGTKGPANCMLACHYASNSNYNLTPADAKAIGAKLRIDIAREAVIESLNTIKAKGLPSERVRVSLSTFSNGLKMLLNPSSDLGAAIDMAGTITLDNTYLGGGTFLWKSIGELSAKLGKGGDGSAATNRLSFVVIFTDGVENDGRMDLAPSSSPPYYNWSPAHTATDWYTTNPSATIQALEPKRCDDLKATGKTGSGNHSVFTIQVEYYLGTELRNAKPWETGVISGIAPQVQQSLQQCASQPEYYVRATDSDQIKPAFQRVTDQIINSEVVHLSK